MRTGGIILCGGRSRRMGTPKAWLPIGGEAMLTRMARVLGDAVDCLVVVAAANQELPPLPPGVTVMRDRAPDQGPLEGLRVGLDALREQVDAAFVSGCDTPLLRPEFVTCLFAFLGSNDVVVPTDEPFFHPLAAVYRPSIVPAIDRLLLANKRKPTDLFQHTTTRCIDIKQLRSADPELQSLVNVNHPDQYEKVLREIESSLDRHNVN